MSELRKVTNDEGRVFNVRVVREGDRYGLNDCLEHDKADPMIEFYDATYEGERFGPRGQFVSRYYLSTLAQSTSGVCRVARSTGGLCLHGGSSVWHVSAANVRDAIDHARQSAYKARAARDAEASGYGDRDYWDYLDQSAQEHHAYFMARGDTEQAEKMLTQSLSEALRGNDGI